MNITRRPKKLILGQHYIISYGFKRKMVCKFIQTTKCGFNFLNINTNKRILTRHLYVSKCNEHSSGDWFWVNSSMYINKCD